MITMLHSIALLGCLAILFQTAFAQFNFFEQMFGGHHQQQQHRPSGESLWSAHSESGESSVADVVIIFPFHQQTNF
jgi:hypothetical protein